MVRLRIVPGQHRGDVVMLCTTLAAAATTTIGVDLILAVRVCLVVGGPVGGAAALFVRRSLRRAHFTPTWLPSS